MSESINDQIERLKNNKEAFCFMDGELKAAAVEIGKSNFNCLCIGSNLIIADWEGGTGSKDFSGGLTYQLHRSYNPAPDKPVFDGYELREVTKDKRGILVFPATRSGISMGIDFAPRYGCCGYVFKENTMEMWDAPVKFAKGKNLSSISNSVMNYKPATLGWVCFKEEKE